MLQIWYKHKKDALWNSLHQSSKSKLVWCPKLILWTTLISQNPRISLNLAPQLTISRMSCNWKFPTFVLVKIYKRREQYHRIKRDNGTLEMSIIRTREHTCVSIIRSTSKYKISIVVNYNRIRLRIDDHN